jgi:hypothetical protein
VSPRIFVAGHRGLVGSARSTPSAGRWRQARSDRHARAAGSPRPGRQSITGSAQTVRSTSISCWHGGRHHGELHQAGEFIYDNMLIHSTVVHAAHLYQSKKLLYLGSSCIYPRDCAQTDDRGTAPDRPPGADQSRHTPSQRSPVSNYVKRIAGSMEMISSPRCRRISTDPTTISTHQFPRPARPDPQVSRGEGGALTRS